MAVSIATRSFLLRKLGGEQQHREPAGIRCIEFSFGCYWSLVEVGGLPDELSPVMVSMSVFTAPAVW